MRISVMGAGYVGLVAGACFADSGNHVTLVDVNGEKIAALGKGIIPIFEPGLEEIIGRNIKAKRLRFSTDNSSIATSNVVFVAVGTPQGHDGGSDLKYLFSAIQAIKDSARSNLTVVLKSTVPVGTADKVKTMLSGARYTFDVVSNPEFLKEGTAVNDFLRPERVLIGTDSDPARDLMSDLYAPYLRSGRPIYFMSNRAAELSKYAANTFLAMKISFINELALLSEKVGADIQDVRRGITSDSRIGSQFLYPGCGYGGSCFPKDVMSLIHVGKESGMEMELFQAVHEINERQKGILFEKIKKHFKNQLKGKTVAIWGLSFKPMTDDMREAPSVTLINQLLEANAKVHAYDPVASNEAKRLFENKITLFDDAYEAAKRADALAVVTEWNEFRTPDFEMLKKEMKEPVLLDGRNIYNRKSLENFGFTYYCIGQPDPV